MTDADKARRYDIALASLRGAAADAARDVVRAQRGGWGDREELARLRGLMAGHYFLTATHLDEEKLLADAVRKLDCTHARSVPSLLVPALNCPDCGAVWRPRDAA